VCSIKSVQFSSVLDGNSETDWLGPKTDESLEPAEIRGAINCRALLERDHQIASYFGDVSRGSKRFLLA